MCWCGAEEPLEPNLQLFGVDDETGKLRLADFTTPEASRYSFTHLAAGDHPLVVRALSEQSAGELSWVLLWHHDQSGPLRIRSQVRLSGLRGQGFRVATAGAVGIAHQPFKGVSHDALRPVDLVLDPASDGVILLVEAESDALDALQERAGCATMIHAAAARRFAPSRSFISWLARARIGIMYLSHDQLERPGLVLVRQPRLDLEPLARSGAIERILRGRDAQAAWRTSPAT